MYNPSMQPMMYAAPPPMAFTLIVGLSGYASNQAASAVSDNAIDLELQSMNNQSVVNGEVTEDTMKSFKILEAALKAVVENAVAINGPDTRKVKTPVSKLDSDVVIMCQNKMLELINVQQNHHTSFHVYTIPDPLLQGCKPRYHPDTGDYLWNSNFMKPRTDTINSDYIEMAVKLKLELDYKAVLKCCKQYWLTLRGQYKTQVSAEAQRKKEEKNTNNTR
ncbi:hypothetical protein C8Q75DRAFT_736551 [Abortiporus biennis]|nr:hypothetical protein C8Q75DRAFT_736551 [Abortiporus biennis]